MRQNEKDKLIEEIVKRPLEEIAKELTKLPLEDVQKLDDILTEYLARKKQKHVIICCFEKKEKAIVCKKCPMKEKCRNKGNHK